MSNKLGLLVVIAAVALCSLSADWGFYGHRELNRFAVFTLPKAMQPLYKPNIAYLKEHAVDPDKRRYAAKLEAVRHYIDLDHFGTLPFEDLPRKYIPAVVAKSQIWILTNRGDTIVEKAPTQHPKWEGFLRRNREEIYQEGYVTVPCDSLRQWDVSSLDCQSALLVDELTPYGIVPYHLPKMLGWLTKAFQEKNIDRILRLSAEIGHYVADAHVPLHTTTNYNGQLTGQLGIHAFWESRLPELYAEETYNNFVGTAEYIADPEPYFWDIVLTSHALVDSVLNIEKRLSQQVPEDQHYCYEDRLGRTVRLPCRDYSGLYHTEMDGMVEERWRATIHSIGSVWYTAWVDAGKPNLREMQFEVPSEIDPEPDIPAASAPDLRQHDY